MRYFRKQRTRILLATHRPGLSQQLSTLLSGHRVLVDSVCELNEAMEQFKHYRHPILLLDEEIIPGSPAHLMNFFQILQKDCLVVILANATWNPRQLGLFAGGVYDVIPLPLEREDLRFRVKRMITHHRLLGNLHYFKLLLMVGALLVPPVFLLLN